MLIVPDGWPCSYAECRPGHFVVGGALMLKSEYGGQGYCESGEAYCGDRETEVQPVAAIWEEFEE